MKRKLALILGHLSDLTEMTAGVPHIGQWVNVITNVAKDFAPILEAHEPGEVTVEPTKEAAAEATLKAKELEIETLVVELQLANHDKEAATLARIAAEAEIEKLKASLVDAEAIPSETKKGGK